MKTESEIVRRMQDIEYALLGKALVFEDCTEYVLRQLANYEFKCSHHKNIFRVFKYLKDNSLPISIDSTWEELLRRHIKDIDKSYLGLMLHDALFEEKLRSVSHTVRLDDLSVCSAEENLSNFIFHSFNEYNENPLRRAPFLLLDRIKDRLDKTIAKTFSIRSARGRSIYDIFSQAETGVLARIKKRRTAFSEKQDAFYDGLPTGYQDIDKDRQGSTDRAGLKIKENEMDNQEIEREIDKIGYGNSGNPENRVPDVPFSYSHAVLYAAVWPCADSGGQWKWRAPAGGL